MKYTKKILFTLSILILSVAAFAKSKTAKKSAADEIKKPQSEVTVFYTNDIHTHLEKDLNYAKIAGLKDMYESQNKAVILADSGDHSQGTAYGGMDHGASMIKLMNEARYDVATIGNHEFDYGWDGFEANFKSAEFKYVACNFYNVSTKKTYADAYTVIEKEGVKIAFVGVMTPETISKSSPAYFMDKKQSKFIWQINSKDLYKTVQNTVDKARKEADYVIILSHLGVDESSEPYTSRSLIANTSGIDVILDGHSHTSIESELVSNKNGEKVLLSQSGNYFDKIGCLTLGTDGKFNSKLLDVKQIDCPMNNSVLDIQNQWKAQVDDDLNTEIAYCSFEMKINDEDGKRIVRKEETNLADFVADGFYYYLNEVEGLDCDITVVNGGGVRTDVPAGEWSYLTCKSVSPFGNVLCLVKVSGKTILDMLEFGERFAGTGGENGGFMHVGGVTFDVDTSVENTVQINKDKIWTGSPKGKYRVCNVKVYNKKTGKYEPLNEKKTYSLGSINYILRSMGDGFAMFGDATLEKDYICEDYLVSARYAGDFKDSDGDGLPDISSANSPLSAYKNYIINYENIRGAGRINIK